MHYLVLCVILLQLTLARTALNEYEVYPFLVKIEAKGKVLDCAGTILSSCTVLTSAHCVDGIRPSEVTVTHVPRSVVKYNVSYIITHPDYNSTVLASDVAILQLSSLFQRPWTEVTLNELDKEQVLRKCKYIEIIGWSGQIMKDPIKSDNTSKTSGVFMEKPMRATVKLISNENCSAVMKNFGGVFQGEEKLCGVTNEEDEEEERCFTGPGGPVLCSLTSKDTHRTENSIPQQYHNFEKKGTLDEPIDLLENLRNPQEKKFKRETTDPSENLQVGVVSWGKSCSKVPSVYIRTDFYSDWIKATSKGLTDICYYEYGTFSVLTPMKDVGATFKCFPLINFVIMFMLITVLLRLL